MNAIGDLMAIGGVGLVGLGGLGILFASQSANPRKDWMKAGVMILVGVVAIEIGVRRL
tara:strand:+ start:414 stop:587 length:174 start_codon:yes stop_codon:yes gene_type:complete